MSGNLKRPASGRNGGQAMVEALVVLVALIPLFLLVPMIGKTGEIKSNTIGAARYSAWERTVYFDHQNHSPSFSMSVASKSGTAISNEAYVRIFSGPDAPIRGNDGQTGAIASGGANQVTAKYTGVSDQLLDSQTAAMSGGRSPGVVNDVVMTVIDFLGGGVENCSGGGGGGSPNAWQDIVQYLTKGDFFLSNCGYVQSDVTVTTKAAISPQLAPFDKLRLTFKQTHVVLSDSWNAGGPTHIRSQVAPFTLTSILDPKSSFLSGVGRAVEDIVAVLWPEFGPVQSDFDYAKDPNYTNFLNSCRRYYPEEQAKCGRMLYFGKIDTEAVPSDRLSGN